MSTLGAGLHLSPGESQVRAKWGWLVALGLLLLVLGCIAFANLFAATIVSVFYVGIVMIIGGRYRDCSRVSGQEVRRLFPAGRPR